MLYELPGEEARPIVDLVAVGNVTHVESGRIGGGWKSIHRDVEIEREIGSTTGARRARIGLAVSTRVDVDLLACGFSQLGRVLFFLRRTPVFAYDDERYGIAEDGALVTLVDEADRLSLPLLWRAGR